MIVYLSITTLCKFVFLNNLFGSFTYMLKLPKAIRHHSRTKLIENPPCHTYSEGTLRRCSTKYAFLKTA